jgi:hypothetical protein
VFNVHLQREHADIAPFRKELDSEGRFGASRASRAGGESDTQGSLPRRHGTERIHGALRFWTPRGMGQKWPVSLLEVLDSAEAQREPEV